MSTSFIYVVQAGKLPFFKIGFSSNIKERIKALQTGCPLPIEIRHRKKDACLKDEQDLHRKLKPWQTCGEWYIATTECLVILHQELGVRLKITSVDDSVVALRVDSHRADFLAAIESTRKIMKTEEAKLKQVIKHAETTLSVLADRESLNAMYKAKQNEAEPAQFSTMWDQFQRDEEEKIRTRGGRARPFQRGAFRGTR